MRVPNISLYNNTRYQLNGITNNLNDANEVMATQKQINTISDDPIGTAQVLGLNESLESLDQYNTNIDMGITWLNGIESSLKSVSDQLLQAKTLSLQLANAAVSASERADAVETIEGIIDQVMGLMNVQVNGSYIFGGTDTNTIPFAYDDPDNPTGVVYSGNSDPFTITSGKTSKLAVGRDGSEVMAEDRIIVDSTNNKLFFVEDPGLGQNSKRTLEATVPDGDYTAEELGVAVKNAMNHASMDFGYEVTYEVEYDSESAGFTILNDGAFDGYMGFDLLWESGESPRVGNVSTKGILLEGVDINVVNGDALVHETPVPDGTAPVRLTWDETDKTWSVLNDPGYDLPLVISGSDSYVELDLSQNGVADLVIDLDSPAEDGGYIEFDISAASNERSIGTDMGFAAGDVSYTPPLSDSEVTLRTFDHTNNVIDFKENAGAGLSVQLSAAIPEGDYSDMNTLASAIETALEDASINSIDYTVRYDTSTNKFTIGEDGSALNQLQLLWNTGTNSGIGAASDLGFDTASDDATALTTSYTSDSQVAMFSINTGVNDAINFKEILPGGTAGGASELTAVIPPGDYYDPESLARAVEDAIEDASALKGNRVDYDVSYDYNSKRFSIEEDGTLGRKLEDFGLLWGSGSDSDVSAADVLGFDEKDAAATPVEGMPVEWGIFETLFALKDYLATDEVDGIQRTLTRLDNHYSTMTSTLADTGIKYNRLEVSQKVIVETTSSLTERRSMIEDADIIEATMNLTAVKTAYEASLSSTAKIINVSLVDYL